MLGKTWTYNKYVYRRALDIGRYSIFIWDTGLHSGQWHYIWHLIYWADTVIQGNIQVVHPESTTKKTVFFLLRLCWHILISTKAWKGLTQWYWVFYSGGNWTAPQLKQPTNQHCLYNNMLCLIHLQPYLGATWGVLHIKGSSPGRSDVLHITLCLSCLSNTSLQRILSLPPSTFLSCYLSLSPSLCCST